MDNTETALFFIGLVPEENILQKYLAIGASIQKELHIQNKFDKCIPHITLKAPFPSIIVDIDQIEEYCDALRIQGPIKLVTGSFGHMGVDIAVLSMSADSFLQKFTEIIDDFCTTLRNFYPQMTFVPYEPLYMPHITFSSQKKIACHSVISFLKERYGDICQKEVTFNKLVIFKKEEKKWIQYYSVPLS